MDLFADGQRLFVGLGNGTIKVRELQSFTLNVKLLQSVHNATFAIV